MSNLFKSGIPYGLDLKKLDEAFPVNELTEGRLLTHEQLEKILQAKRGTSRYYGVVDSWISKTKNTHGLFIAWEPSAGLRVLDPAQILTRTETRTRQKIRQTGRVMRDFAWVDRKRLDSPGQQRLDHQLRVATAIRQSLDDARKQLAVELGPIKSLPKPKLPTPVGTA